MMVGNCGHTMCKKCSEPLTKCPLCQSHLDSSKMIKNYGMLEFEDEELSRIRIKQEQMKLTLADDDSSVDSDKGMN